MRNTRQPARRNVRVTSRSRAWFAANFFRQNAALPLGIVPCIGQPCQKHPSTNTASRAARNTKSGLTWNLELETWNFSEACLRHPVTRCR